MSSSETLAAPRPATAGFAGRGNGPATARHGRARAKSRATGLLIFGLGLAGMALQGCTARPLYASADAGAGSSAYAPTARLASLRGRIGISDANSRTDQLVRNALLSRLNQGARVSQPLYEVRLVIAGDETGIAIEPNGQLSSSLYKLTATYTVVRLAGGQTITTGKRTETVPFDRTGQLFQAQRALINARQQAADSLAARLEVPISIALEKAGG